ncbi:MAG: SURF1 family protein [Alcaligenaceae bacterium]
MPQLIPKTRTVLAVTLLAVVGATCIALGIWQLNRATERRAIASSIQQGQAMTALDLNGSAPDPVNIKNWTPAKVQGQWRGDLSVLLDNRNLEGRPGLWLATPLVMTDGRAVLVLRGWFARPLGDQKAPVVATTPDIQQLSGELAEHVPRMFELWSSSRASSNNFGFKPQALASAQIDSIDTAKLQRVQNLSLAELSDQSGLNLLPVVLLQTSASNDGLIRVWPKPSVDADKNTGYAMQWFGFATICLIALLAMAWRIRRNR